MRTSALIAVCVASFPFIAVPGDRDDAQGDPAIVTCEPLGRGGRFAMGPCKFLSHLGVFLAVFFALEPTPALAKCRDRPKPEVDWSKCEKERLILRNADLSGATLQWTDFSMSDMTDAKLAGAILVRANLAMARLRGANLEGADMTKVQADRTDFEAANLAGVNLSKSELSRANLTDANLSGANLTKAELGRAELKGADLEGASLRYANIARAKFSGLKLAGVKFGGAYMLRTRFEGADLSQTEGLIQQQIESACGDEKTKLPSNLQRPATWPCAQDE